MLGGLLAVVVPGRLHGALSEAAAADLARVGLGLHAGIDDKLEQYETFGDWLGRKVMYRVVFCDMTSWAGIAAPWFLGATRQWLDSDPRRVEVISLPLLPKGEEGNFSAITSGAHDADFASFARRVQTRGIAARVIVRLAWEGNGDWYPWAYGRNPDGFRAAFRRAVKVMREIAPDLRIEWCISSRAPRRDGAAWTEGYPGDDVVDVISMDVYDEYNMTWDTLLKGEAGLQELRAFAIARNKLEAYPEWGCSTNSKAQGGGDNVWFIERMAEWFAARPGKVLYHGYWNTSAAGPNAAIHTSKPTLVPNAAAAYRRLFGIPDDPSEPSVR